MNLKSSRRKLINLSQEKLIKTNFLLPEQHLSLLIEPVIDSIDLAAWANNSLDWIKT